MDDQHIPHDDFKDWMAVCSPGDRMIYRWGHNTFAKNQDLTANARLLMLRVRNYQKSGKVALFQYTDDHGYYEYIAVRVSPQANEFLEHISKKVR